MDNDYSWIMKDIGDLVDQGDLLRYRGLRRISWDLEGSRSLADLISLLFSAPQAKILRILEGRRPKNSPFQVDYEWYWGFRGSKDY